jgi:hypothetical protein
MGRKVWADYGTAWPDRVLVFCRLEVDVPALAPSYLNCTVYLYPSREAAERGSSIGGTGFLVAVKSRHADRLYVHVVTNRHVVDGGNRVIRFNTTGGGFSSLASEPEEWEISPDDDLAVLGTDIPKDAEWSAIGLDEFLDEGCEIEGWPIFPGDEVVFFGRFTTHEGRQRNKPVMRFGNISMLPDPNALVRIEGDHEQLAFLVECRSLSGFSGSPAFVHLAQPRWMSSEQDKKGWISTGIRLLGVDCAHLSFWSPVCEQKNRGTVLSDMWVETNSGIAVIVPAWRLARLINGERLVKERDKVEQRLDEEIPWPREGGDRNLGS